MTGGESSWTREGASCGVLCRVVELNAHGPRHTVTDVNSDAHYTCTIMGHDLAQHWRQNLSRAPRFTPTSTGTSVGMVAEVQQN
jgi:secreted trypsin-like serine protease